MVHARRRCRSGGACVERLSATSATREREHGGADRHVDEEDPSQPRYFVRMPPMRPDRGAAPAHSSPDAECLVSLGSLGEASS